MVTMIASAITPPAARRPMRSQCRKGGGVGRTPARAIRCDDATALSISRRLKN